MSSLDIPLVRRLIEVAIEEDLPHGDITTESCINESQNCEAIFLAKEDMVVCGISLLPIIYSVLRYNIKIEDKVQDGMTVRSGAVLARIRGSARQILSSERIALNFMQRLSGIASKTKEIVAANPGLKILDTRKTTPGLRVLEKYAVKTGGGTNHRASLSDMVLIKNNHIDANAGNLALVIETVRAKMPNDMLMEVEVRDFKELETALLYKPDMIMPDNMNDADVKKGIEIINSKSPQTEAEVSGGINADRLRSLREIGVKCVSMGALTNKASSVDISLRIQKYK